MFHNHNDDGNGNDDDDVSNIRPSQQNAFTVGEMKTWKIRFGPYDYFSFHARPFSLASQSNFNFLEGHFVSCL